MEVQGDSESVGNHIHRHLGPSWFHLVFSLCVCAVSFTISGPFNLKDLHSLLLEVGELTSFKQGHFC